MSTAATTTTTNAATATSSAAGTRVRRFAPWLLGASLLLGAACTPAGGSEPEAITATTDPTAEVAGTPGGDQDPSTGSTDSGGPHETTDASVDAEAGATTGSGPGSEGQQEPPAEESPATVAPATTTTAPPAPATHPLSMAAVGDCLDTSPTTPLELPCGSTFADAEILALTTDGCSGDGAYTLSFSSKVNGVTQAFEFCLSPLGAAAQPAGSYSETDGRLAMGSCFTTEPADAEAAAAAAAGAEQYEVVVTEVPCTTEGPGSRAVVGEVAKDQACAEGQARMDKLPLEPGFITHPHWCHAPR